MMVKYVLGLLSARTCIANDTQTLIINKERLQRSVFLSSEISLHEWSMYNIRTSHIFLKKVEMHKSCET